MIIEVYTLLSDRTEKFECRCTLDAFFAENNSFEAPEIEQIRHDLEENGVHRILGFVGCAWVIRRVDEKKKLRTNAGDASCNYLHCGDCVRSKVDERFTGTVLCITSGTAKVRWHDTNWIGFDFVHDLEKI